MYQLPENRQLSRLNENLIKANILQDGIIKTDVKNTDPKLSGEIYDGINYICKLNNCDSIKEIFNSEYKEFEIKHRETFEERKAEDLNTYASDADDLPKVKEREYRKPSKWEIVNAITDKIHVKRYYEQNQ